MKMLALQIRTASPTLWLNISFHTFVGGIVPQWLLRKYLIIVLILPSSQDNYYCCIAFLFTWLVKTKPCENQSEGAACDLSAQ